MPPKDLPERQTNAFTEVEKQFYELELAYCNRRVARLKETVIDLEQRNEELQKNYDKLDEDRADVITYLKKRLTVITEECTELKDKVKGLEEIREIEKTEFTKTVSELEKNFTTMKDQLTSENKLLAGKLNTLEEFRAIKIDLMIKFDNQQKAFEDQEIMYKRMLYDAEKKFVIGKDRLKREMEGKLLQLAQDFQDASELRIAASTHRVIRENVALNNQLDTLLICQAKVSDQNEKLREDERGARLAMEVAEQERDEAINKNILQSKVIEQLTTAYENVKRNQALFDKRLHDEEEMQRKIKTLLKENETLALQVRILEQNLHSRLGKQSSAVVETAKMKTELERFRNILKYAEITCLAALKTDELTKLDPAREISERREIIQNILSIIIHCHDGELAESMESLTSLSKVYELGDLGFVPKRKTKETPSERRLSSESASSEKVGRKSSSKSSSIVTSTKSSLKTIPSLQIMPSLEATPVSSKESIQSFTVTSLHSTPSSSEESVKPEEDMDMEHLLAKSKADVQKSLIRDLVLSQQAFASASRLSLSRSRIRSRRSSLHVAEQPEKEGDLEGEETLHARKSIMFQIDETKDAEADPEKKDEADPEKKDEADPEKKDEAVTPVNEEPK